MISIDRVIERLSSLEAKNDWTGAQKHLEYWLTEAQSTGDSRSALQLHNELMGLCRKCGHQDEAIVHAENALKLISDLKLENTVTAGTVWINAATVYKAFGMPTRALPLFEEAMKNYNLNLDLSDPRFGGLYNNMALCLADLHEYDKAKDFYQKAFDLMGTKDQGKLEQAITLLNLADLTTSSVGPEEGEKEINRLIDEAFSLLSSEELERNGYFAFVCDKCAPSFGYYGYFLYEETLKKWSKDIHERA